MRLFDEIDRSEARAKPSRQRAPAPQPKAPPAQTPQPQRLPMEELARQFNLPKGDVAQVIEIFIPAITNGMKRNVKRGGAEALIEALQRGQHSRYLDEPERLERPEARHEGDSILGHIFGSKDVSRELAKRTAQRTGIDSGILKKMLPMVAQLTMGAMRNQGGQAGMLDKSRAKEPSIMEQLMGMLDADGKDSPIDDLLGFLK